MIRRGLFLSMLLVAWGSTASAQLISIRTVPVSQSHQFEFFPSTALPMGGVRIALPDSLLDPFVNPAAGTRVGATRFFGAPNVFSVSDDAGGGRTLPLGALTRAGAWHGGLWLALQQVDRSERSQFLPCPVCTSASVESLTNTNSYAHASLGRTLGTKGLSIGGSLMWSGLNAIDGVDLLYAGARDISQSGHSLDMRLALLKEWDDSRTFEAVLVHNRISIAHAVQYVDMVWDPTNQQFTGQPRSEENLDRTNTWGLHLGWQQPIAGTGWRIGWIATANRMDHPKIPNYEIMNIPRDPGNSSAFNVGLGIARSVANARFGVDVIYEPIWSHTWADAAEPVTTAEGEMIAAGGMTIENRFRFHNAALRLGFDQRFMLPDGVGAGLQLGLRVRSFDYQLRQWNHIEITNRRQHEDWVEWTPTWGLLLGFPTLDVRYRGSVTHGTGRPGVANNGGVFTRGDIASTNILVAPSGPLTLGEVRVVTHEISVSLPLR
jgi:hypothetical protein